MFNKKDETVTLESTQLELIVSLIKEKYDSDRVKGRVTNNPDKVSVVFLNGLSGADNAKIDDCNTRPIEFLKAHNGEVTKEEHEHYSYWSYSVVTVNKEMLTQIIEGLSVLLPTRVHEPDHRMMARC